MTTPLSSQGQQPTRRWIFVLLIASLMANFLFVGIAAGKYWSHGHGWFGHGHHRTGGIKRFMSDLPKERRDVLQAQFEGHRESLKPLRDEVRRLRQEVRDVMKREPLDQVALRQALEGVNQARDRLSEVAATGLLELAAKMTAGERADFVAREQARADRRLRRSDRD